jgi:hypothetical protein
MVTASPPPLPPQPTYFFHYTPAGQPAEFSRRQLLSFFHPKYFVDTTIGTEKTDTKIGKN